ncbi:hypothetical protein SVIOM342S_00023 [Streptomyces violaceorubidus]
MRVRVCEWRAGVRCPAVRGAQEGVCHTVLWFPSGGGEPIVKVMFAVYAARIDRDEPLAGLELGELPAPEARPGWSVVDVRAASLDHHDLGPCAASASPRTGCR